MASPEEPGSTTELNYHTKGPVPESMRDEASATVEKLASMAPRPIIFARVKVTVDDDRNPDESAVVQGTIDVSGELIRAQAAAEAPLQALRIVEQRLERRLSRLAERREQQNERPPFTPEGEWRSGDLPSKRPGYFDRPPEEREIIRRKTYPSEERISVEEAVFDLDVLDYRFFLFTDVSDGTPSVVYERDGDVLLRRIDGSRPPEDALRISIDVNETPAPSISAEDAIERLGLSDEAFIFFQDSEEETPRVLYRRYDGHYGLVEPAA